MIGIDTVWTSLIEILKFQFEANMSFVKQSIEEVQRSWSYWGEVNELPIGSRKV